MGRSRGGLTTKIHALVDANGLPLELVLTPCQVGFTWMRGLVGDGSSTRASLGMLSRMSRSPAAARTVQIMPPAERCRTLAARIRRLVWKTNDSLIQAQLEDTARYYDEMAEKLEREGTDKPPLAERN